MFACEFLAFLLQELSQFWYDDKTAEVLAKEAIHAAGDHGRYNYLDLLSIEYSSNCLFAYMHSHAYIAVHP